MSTRVEGQVALKFHGFLNADTAAQRLHEAIVRAEEDEELFGPGQSVEVTQIALYQVVETSETGNQVSPEATSDA